MSDDELLPSNNSSTPRKSTKTNTPSGNEILKAYQVNAFKYVNKKYENRGKVGLALLGSKLNNHFNLLLYGKGNAHITQASVNSELDISTSKELYVNFYDVKSENWSILFDSMELFCDFLSRICIYKMITSNKPEMLTFDLKSGDGISAQDSDLCEIELTINGVKNCEISTVIYSSEDQDVLRTKIGSNKLMLAVEKGLVGMSKGGYRMIGVPCKCPFIKGGSINIPQETHIIVFIKLVRTKSKCERPTNVESNDMEMALPNINFDMKPDADSEVSEKSKKAELLSRMAKMGKPIPAFNAEHNSNDNTSKNYNYIPNIPNTSHDMNIVQPMMQNPIAYHNLYNPSIMSNQLLPIHSINPQTSSINPIFSQVPTGPSPTNDFNLIFTETRQNNTEMRVAISKLQDKLDRIAEKIDAKATNTQQSVSRYMDAENVFDNIKRIINENESLKLECNQKSDMIEKQNKKIGEMLKNNQLYLEESHNVIQRNSISFSSSATEHQGRILQLEEEKLNLIRNLSQKTAEVSQSEMKLEEVTQNAQTYRTKSLEYSDQINKLTEEVGDLKLKNRSLLTELNDMKLLRNSDAITQEEFETRRKQWTEEESVLQNKIEVLRSNLSQANLKISQIKSDSETEINEVRQQCHQELEEIKNKLKQERKRINNKSSDLAAEIEQINQSWEEKFEENRQSESVKLSKLTEKGSHLMVENANLNREVIELNEQLSAMRDIQSSESSELKMKNRTLTEQLNELQRKSVEMSHLAARNDSSESEIIQLKEEIRKLEEKNATYDDILNKNENLKSELAALKKENMIMASAKVASLETETKAVNVEEKIKKIMNDVFKKIKEQIIADEKYSGKDVISKCLIIIRDSTMANISGDHPADNDKSDEEDDEESEENSGTDEELESHNIDNDGKTLESVIESLNINENKIEDTVESFQPMESSLQRLETDSNLEEIKSELIDVNESLEKYSESKDQEIYQNSMNNDEENNISIDMTESEILNPNNQDIMKIDDNAINTPELFMEQVILPTEEAPKLEITDQSIIPTTPVETIDQIVHDENRNTVVEVTNTKKETVFSSDEEDEVLDFFEKLSQKNKTLETKVKTDKPKSVMSDPDDDLSWLNN